MKPVNVIRMNSLAAAVWRNDGEHEPCYRVTLHRWSTEENGWTNAEEFDESERPFVDAVSDLALAWILNNSNGDDDTNNHQPLGIGTEPAGEGNSCLPVRPHRGQGPVGLNGVSRDDDGRVRQDEEPSRKTLKTLPDSNDRSLIQSGSSTPERTAASGTLTVLSGSRQPSIQLASYALAPSSHTPDAPDGANETMRKASRTPDLAGHSASASRLHGGQHCYVSGLFSGVYRVYRFHEREEELRVE